MKVKGQTVQAGERYKRTDGRIDGQTDRQSDGRYQVHYLPCFAVDNNSGKQNLHDEQLLA